MYQNADKPFFHPVTHRLIEPGQFYNSPAHLDHENKAESTLDEIVDEEDQQEDEKESVVHGFVRQSQRQFYRSH